MFIHGDTSFSKVYSTVLKAIGRPSFALLKEKFVAARYGLKRLSMFSSSFEFTSRFELKAEFLIQNGAHSNNDTFYKNPVRILCFKKATYATKLGTINVQQVQIELA